MSKDSPSFSDLGSEPPVDCPLKYHCRQVLRQPSQERGDYILDNDDVHLGMTEPSLSGGNTGDASIDCHVRNGSGCAFEPIMKRDYREYRDRGTTPSA
jgi:hypothetical protein